MNGKRFLAILLCAMMIVSLLPAAAFAEPAEDEEIIYADDEIIAEEAPAEEEIPAAEEAADEEITEVPAEEASADDEIPEISEDEEIPDEPETEDDENELEVIVANGKCGAGLVWKLDDKGKLTISGSGAMSDWDWSSGAPWSEYSESIKTASISSGVTRIGEGAFILCGSLTSITIPSSVTSIGEGAFYLCVSLTSITIPDGVTSIDYCTFYGCESLTSVTIPGSVTRIGNSAFSDCYSLTSVTIPNGVTSIGDCAFVSCVSLTSVTIPNSVTSIGGSAFLDCCELTSVTIPGGVTSIGDEAFYDCTELRSIIFRGNAPSFGGQNVFHGVIATAYYPADNSSWTSDVMQQYGGTITWTEDGRINPLTGTCGESINWILDNKGNLVISGSGAMTDWDDDSPAPWYSGSTPIKSVTISGNVTSIGDYAFVSCNDLISITIPASVTSIGKAAFAYCSLTSITIPASVKSIGESAFFSCIYLTSIIFKGNAPSFEDDCFSDVTATVYYPAGDSSWTDDVMQQYGGTITWEAAGESAAEISGLCGESLVWTLDSEGVLTISGSGAMTDWDWTIGSSAPWDPYTSSIKTINISADVTSIGKYAFTCCDSLTSITIPDSVTSIGGFAFSGCSELRSISIPNSVTDIGERAFEFCDSLTSITIPAGVTSIGINAFHSQYLAAIYVEWDNESYCSDDGVLFSYDGTLVQYPMAKSGTAYTIPEGVTSIGDWAFLECWDLTSVSIPDSVTSIGEWAFESCSSLTGITIPKSVTSIGEGAFGDCSSLTSITFKGNAPSFHDLIFTGVTATAYYPADNSSWTTNVMQNYGGKITWTADGTVTVASGSCAENLLWKLDSEGVLTIWGSGAMNDYSVGSAPWYNYSGSIKTVSISGNVTRIGDFAFENCSSLTSVSIPDGVTSIGKSAFFGCDELESISIPEGVTSIGNGAFVDCAFTNITIPASVTSIGSSAFENCCMLTVINVASGNTSYKSVDGVLFSYDGKTIVRYPEARTETAYTIPEGVTSIEGGAFFHPAELKSITIPEGVTSIGDYAFEMCYGLTSITFKGNAPSFGNNCFCGVTATAYYPAGTWRGSSMQNYGGTITWVPVGAASEETHGTPAITRIDNHADYMIVRWGKVEGATGYKLAYRAGGGEWQTMDVALSAVDGNGNPRVNLKGLTMGTTYTFIAYAIFGDGESTKSESAAQVRLLSPDVTVKKYGTDAANGGFRLDWTATEGGSCYKIYYREQGGSWALYTMIPKSANTLFVNIKGSVTNANENLPDLVAGTTYEFAVLTATSQTNITSGFPTSYTGYTF